MQRTVTPSRASVVDIDEASLDLSRETIARRRSNRRNMLAAVMLSALVDAGLFGLYAAVGATTFATPVVYLACGVMLVLLFLVLSENRFQRSIH